MIYFERNACCVIKVEYVHLIVQSKGKDPALHDAGSL